MKKLICVYKTALKGLLSSMPTYLYFAAVTAVGTVYAVYFNVYSGAPSLEYTMRYMALPIMIFAPLITVGAFSGKGRADAILFSLGLSSHSLLFGRMLAVLTVGIAPMIPMALLIPVMAALGSTEILTSLLALLWVILFCAAYLASLTAVSVICDRPRICAAVSYGVLVISYLGNLVCSRLPKTSALTLIAFLPIAVLFGLTVFLLSRKAGQGVLSACAVTVIFSLTCAVSATAAYNAVHAAYTFLCAPYALGALLYGGRIDIFALICLILHTAFFSALAVIFLEKRFHEPKGGRAI